MLCAVTIKMHVRNEKDFSEHELNVGLVTAQELAVMTGQSPRGTTYSLRDGKRDRFPSKSRPGLVLLLLQSALCDLYREGHLLSPPHREPRRHDGALSDGDATAPRRSTNGGIPPSKSRANADPTPAP